MTLTMKKIDEDDYGPNVNNHQQDDDNGGNVQEDNIDGDIKLDGNYDEDNDDISIDYELYELENLDVEEEVLQNNFESDIHKAVFSMDPDLHPNSYRVELPKGGELVMVYRFLDDVFMIEGFHALKLQVKLNKSKWFTTSTLGNVAFFLGDNYSTSVCTSDYMGCHPDCIYFTDDYVGFYMVVTPYAIHGGGGPSDNGFFNLKEKAFGKHYKLHPSHQHMPPPIWIVPKFKY
ncbi:unnamed protein product [Dovyalis caffra]|uniref:KIB1-4 beta-propeller domain-containing protein n=1 Tax=Dovyalis caffra TaxID=77055 RepID=A0AAV1SHH1_9ROSI|nr:unnamed protein product [Dovyalis caffra]